jgi:hypothetical protein
VSAPAALTGRNQAQRDAIVGQLGELVEHLRSGRLAPADVRAQALALVEPAQATRKARWNLYAAQLVAGLDGPEAESDDNLQWLLVQHGLIALGMWAA